MLTSFTLTNFRGFAKLEVSKLARVNLIGGVNNAGKTTILEAIYLLLEIDPEKIAALPHLFRPASGINDIKYFWRWISRDSLAETDFTLAATATDMKPLIQNWRSTEPDFTLPSIVQEHTPARRIRHVDPDEAAEPKIFALKRRWPLPIAFSPEPTAPVENARVYIDAVRKSADNEEHVEALLHEIDPRIKKIRSFPDEKTNQPLLHVGLASGKAMPASQFGQGFNRLLRIYSALFASDAKVFLIDEIETGLHHSALPTIWKGLAAVARQEDVQIFATTHSREAILAAHRVFSSEPQYDFAYHRLERDSRGEVQVVTYDQEALSGADEANFEVR